MDHLEPRALNPFDRRGGLGLGALSAQLEGREPLFESILVGPHRRELGFERLDLLFQAVATRTAERGGSCEESENERRTARPEKCGVIHGAGMVRRGSVPGQLVARYQQAPRTT